MFLAILKTVQQWISQKSVFGEIEGRVTKMLSQEFSMTENCTLGALSRLDNFQDDSKSDFLSEASIFRNETAQNSGPEDGQDR